MSRRFLAVFLFPLLLYACSNTPGYPPPPEAEGFIRIDLKGLGDAEPVFFTREIDGVGVSFFVLRIGDEVQSYLDACMKCYPHKKGYLVDGFYLECRYCNVRYSLDRLSEGVGSCFPIPLKGSRQGDVYLIPLEELESGVQYFR